MKTNPAVTFLCVTILAFITHTSLADVAKDDEITSAVKAFADGLTEAERATASLPFDDPARLSWTNLPVGMVKRPGIQFGALSSASKKRVHHVLTTLLSSQGYLKVTSLMNMDDILNTLYERAYAEKKVNEETYQMTQGLDWGLENYFVSLYGQPGADAPWGFKFEGHHISINCSSDGSHIAVTPLFLGDDQAEVTETEYSGLRVLSKEEDYAFRFIRSLAGEQRKAATISDEVPADIITRPDGPQRLEKMQGLAAGTLSVDQKILLRRLISEYVDNLEFGKREDYWDKVERGFDATHFGWIGSYEQDKPHYYIIHGPEIMIEYDNISWDKEGADHIHTIIRDVNNDFGADLLRAHYAAEGHP